MKIIITTTLKATIERSIDSYEDAIAYLKGLIADGIEVDSYHVKLATGPLKLNCVGIDKHNKELWEVQDWLFPMQTLEEAGMGDFFGDIVKKPTFN